MPKIEFGERWKRWDCVVCGKPNPRTSEKCHSCGAPASGGPQVESQNIKPPKLEANQWLCPACNIPVTWGNRCAKCGSAGPGIAAIAKESASANGVVITGLDIPFGTLVGFMVKLALAAIPAAIIFALIYSLIAALVTGNLPFGR